MTIKLTARISNDSKTTIGLQVEPWGEYYRIAPGTHVDILTEGTGRDEGVSDDGLLDIKYGVELITVYAWQRCEMQVVGAEMAPWGRPPAKEAVRGCDAL